MNHLNQEQRMHFRDQFRDARDFAHKDTENFAELLFVLERLGQVLHGSMCSLGAYRDDIVELASKSPLANDIPDQAGDWHVPVGELFQLVKEARNDALHQGAYARHLTTHAVQLALVLEDALMNDSSRVRNFMVRNPVCAETWQPLSFIRQKMLENSFSFLPVLDADENWKLVSDHSLCRFLRVQSNGERKRRLATSLEDAIGTELELEEPDRIEIDATVNDALGLGSLHPILVIDTNDRTRLLGILTSFDML